MNSNHYNKINILNPEHPHDIIATSLALIDTGAIHGSYAGSWLLAHKLRHGSKFIHKKICSPINNTCISLTDSVVAIVDIFDVDNKFKFNYELEFKILSALDDKDYGIIIGLPDIKENLILNHFAHQFMVDRKDSHDSKRWKVALLDEIPVGNTLADKFANLGEIPRMIPNSVQLKRRRLLRTNSPNTNTSYQSGLTSRFLSYEDMLGNVLEGLPQYVFQPPSKYDEDKERCHRLY